MRYVVDDQNVTGQIVELSLSAWLPCHVLSSCLQAAPHGGGITLSIICSMVGRGLQKSCKWLNRPLVNRFISVDGVVKIYRAYITMIRRKGNGTRLGFLVSPHTILI